MKSIIKNFLILFTAFFITSCVNNQQNKSDNQETKSGKFDWLLGNWKRVNEEKGKSTFETWEKISDSQYNGVGYTLQAKDTINKEDIKIVETDGKWRLLVRSLEDIDFIPFEMSNIQADKFECKNDTLGFPELIKYWKNGDRINASVSGMDLNYSYEFERIK